MKHFYLILTALLLAFSTQAQTTDPARQKLDLIFANLDKSQVPTGRLAEAALVTCVAGAALAYRASSTPAARARRAEAR